MTNYSVAKGAIDPGNCVTPRLFYRAAREGFQDFLSHVPGAAERGILLPAFIGWSPREGSGMFDPVRGSGTPPSFYELNPDLTVDLQSLEDALASQRPAVTVLIHYWGRTDPCTEQVAALASKYRSILVEDLAHAYFSRLLGAPAGLFGGVNLYSLHKMFPLSEGGMIEYCDRSLLKGQRETLPDLVRTVASYDSARISRMRRENFLRLTGMLRVLPEHGSEFTLVWPDLADHDVPQSLPVRIHARNRDSVYASMNAEGFGMTSIYHTLIEELRGRFPKMNEMAATITNFPIHQDVEREELAPMVQSFQTALRVGRAS